ncbi:MAG: hypothetical protein CMG85_17265 [Marinobacter sp.]|nr:hypothetical protein [Marinobacter sp.]
MLIIALIVDYARWTMDLYAPLIQWKEFFLLQSSKVLMKLSTLFLMRLKLRGIATMFWKWMTIILMEQFGIGGMKND